MRPLIFLDIDGVLNGSDWVRDQDGACNIRRECVRHLAHIVAETDARIVLSSSWRYMIHRGAMTAHGFGYMLRTHGLTGGGRDLIVGVTREDAEVADPSEIVEHQRALQVLDWLAANPGIGRWLAIDDDDDGFTALGLPLLKTDPAMGLTAGDARAAILMLKGGRA